MKHKRLIAAFIAAGMMMGCTAAFADEIEVSPSPLATAESTALPQEDILVSDGDLSNDVDMADAAQQTMITSFDLYFDCVLDAWPRKDYAVFNICSEDGTILDSHTVYIAEPEGFCVNFTVPASPVGTVFYLEVSGVNSIDYFSDNYVLPLESMLPLYTYWSEPNEYGERTPVTEAYMTTHMRTQPVINISVDGEPVQLSSPAIFEGSSIIAPLSEIAEAIGISDCTYYPQYDSVRVETGDDIMYVNIGSVYYSMYDQDLTFNIPVSNINSLTYVELRPFVQAFGSTLEFADNGSSCDIALTKSPKAISATAAQEARMNESGIGSSTEYMIWVNKEKFRCSVFKGSRGDWKWVKDFTVGIGAEGSETVTGVFEYTDYVSMWPYASYYVGPVMVFYGNYALHSTFLNYDGTPYNNNVGMKISHGCVRCQAKYINWMTDNIPLRTRVYVTEN